MDGSLYRRKITVEIVENYCSDCGKIAKDRVGELPQKNGRKTEGVKYQYVYNT